MDPQGSRPRWWIRGLVPGVLLGIGILHTFVGLFTGRSILSAIAREGVWNTVRSDPGPISRSLLLWFLAAGFFLLMLGHLAWWVERHARRPLPGALGVELLLFAMIFGVVMGGPVQALLFVAAGAYILLIAITARERGQATSA